MNIDFSAKKFSRYVSGKDSRVALHQMSTTRESSNLLLTCAIGKLNWNQNQLRPSYSQHKSIIVLGKIKNFFKSDVVDLIKVCPLRVQVQIRIIVVQLLFLNLFLSFSGKSISQGFATKSVLDRGSFVSQSC